MKYVVTSALIMFACLVAKPAEAHHRYHHKHYASHHQRHHRQHYDGNRVGGRPSAWCGYYMRQIMGVADAAYNLARNWSHWGSPSTPHIGAVVVWPHHVGKIVGGSPGHWAVLSGNDGHRVRTRVRSIAGAIAIRA